MAQYCADGKKELCGWGLDFVCLCNHRMKYDVVVDMVNIYMVSFLKNP